MVKHTRRRYLKGAGSAAAVGLAGCMGGGGKKSLKTILPAGTVYYPWGKSALSQGFFEDEGINLEIEYKPFPAYAQSLSSGEVDISLRSIMPAVNNYNKGEDLVTWGMAGGLQGINGMYTRADMPYDTIEELKGQTVGVFSWGSSSVQSFQGLITDQTGLRLREDFKTTTAAPPALQGLLDKGEIQAAIEVSSITIAMEARSDKYQRLGQLNEMWQAKTGFNLALVSWFSYGDWYKENKDVAKGIVKASKNATKYWRENTRDILKEYGEPAAIDDKIEIDVVDRWTNQGSVFAGDVSGDFVDATWKYLQLMAKYGFIDKVPPQDKLTRAPL